MPLITDPDNLSQGLKTDVTDAAWTSSSGANTTITSSSNLPTLAAGDFFEVRFHSVPGNNGLYIATGSPTASSLPATKVDGTNPTDQTAEDVDILGDNGAASEYKSVMIDTGQKFLYLIEKGNLGADGVTEQVVYSFLKEEWKSDATLIQHTFPMVAVTPEQFELTGGWKFRDVAAQSIRTTKLIRTGGWSEISTDDYLIKQYTGVVTLGSFEDEANDYAHYQLGNDPTDTSAATDFTFPGPVDESVLVYVDFGVPGDVVVTGNNTITSATGGFTSGTDKFLVGGRVTIQDAEDTGNDGSWVLSSVSNTVLVVEGTPLTNNADDTTMRLAIDNRNALQLFLRVRDGDPEGKTFDSSNIAAIGFSTVDNKAFRFPLSNQTDLNIEETDANIAANTPYTEIRARYLDAAYNRDVDLVGTPRNFGIIIDVGTYSESNGSTNTNTLVTSANLSLGAGEALADYAGGTLRLHEGTDKGLYTIVGTPVDNSGTLEITINTSLTASENNLSFTMDRSTPLTATTQEIYEKIQYLLRQDADIDSTDSVVNGSTADELLDFVGSDLKCGLQSPTNPNGGGSGVICEGFDTNYTNNLFFFDNGGTSRNYPYVAAGTMLFNANLVSDSDPEYWMYFEYIKRTTVADFAISGASGSTASFDSSGANLPTVSQWDYVRLTDMTNEENNGVWLVTDAAPTTSQFDATKVDGQTVVNEGSASHPVDWKPIDSPQAIIVNNNSGSPIEGAIGASSIGFDFDYDNNVQGGRTAATNAAIVIRAIGLETGKFAETLGTITRATGLSFSVVSEYERNYVNP